MATRVPRESKFPPDKTAQQVIIELADTKNHAGSLIKITPDGKPIHYIIPNYWQSVIESIYLLILRI
jgi:hypothetical protein